MNKKVLIVVGVIIAAGIGLAVSMLNHPSQRSGEVDDKNKVSRTTSDTDPTDPNVKSDLENNIDTSQPSDGSNTLANGNEGGLSTAERADYIEFESTEQFKNTEGTRVLFFYASSSKACEDLDKDLQENIATLDPETTIFRTDIKEHEDIAKAYGVVKESTILKFDDSGEVNGLFISHDYPTAQALKTNLQI